MILAPGSEQTEQLDQPIELAATIFIRIAYSRE
jgi:hypothetical protein